MTFIEGLERHRIRIGLGHVAFAHYLGMSHGYWSLVRRGKKPAGDGFIGRVVSAHPELAELLREPREDRVAA